MTTENAARLLRLFRSWPVMQSPCDCDPTKGDCNTGYVGPKESPDWVDTLLGDQKFFYY